MTMNRRWEFVSEYSVRGVYEKRESADFAKTKPRYLKDEEHRRELKNGTSKSTVKYQWRFEVFQHDNRP